VEVSIEALIFLSTTSKDNDYKHLQIVYLSTEQLKYKLIP